MKVAPARPGFDPWVGKIPGEGKGYPLQYSDLENSMDYTVHGVTELERLSDFHFHLTGSSVVKKLPAKQEAWV